jgi:hypothetical protein
MNASQVLNAMNERWSELLDKYYDHVADEYIKHISKEYDMDYEELLSKAKELKSEIMKNAKEIMECPKASEIKKKQPSKTAIKAAEKAAKKENEFKNAYSDLTRSQIIEKCKECSLPVKRKNQDMIDALLKYDESSS